MDLEERTLEDTLEKTCTVCGARLTGQGGAAPVRDTLTLFVMNTLAILGFVTIGVAAVAAYPMVIGMLPMMLGSIILGVAVAIPAYFAARAAIDAHQRRRRSRLRSKAALTRA